MKLFLFLYLFSILIFPQEYIFKYSIGNFNDASSFHINSAGFIYVADAGNDEVIKLDTSGNVLEEIGGYGWDEAAFDDPVDLYSTSLNVYVCDKNNHRIQRFDKDLNFISSLSTKNIGEKDKNFGFPLSCAVSNQGDLYILDSENRRIIHFDLFGNFIQNFGGYDAGIYSLVNPGRMAISNNGNIYVIDKKNIVLFDQFGSGVSIIKTDSDLKGINIIYNNLTLNSNNKIIFADLNKPEPVLNELSLIGYDEETEIVSSFILYNKLYILTENNILVFEKGEDF